MVQFVDFPSCYWTSAWDPFLHLGRNCVGRGEALQVLIMYLVFLGFWQKCVVVAGGCSLVQSLLWDSRVYIYDSSCTGLGCLHSLDPSSYSSQGLGPSEGLCPSDLSSASCSSSYHSPFWTLQLLLRLPGTACSLLHCTAHCSAVWDAALFTPAHTAKKVGKRWPLKRNHL